MSCKMNVFLKLSCFLSLIFLLSCQKEPQILAGKRGDLIDFFQRGSLTKPEVIERITEVTKVASPGFVKYDVTYYSITYRTEYLGQPIDTRGLLILPNGVNTTRLIMYCHGTLAPSATLGADASTPSLYQGSNETSSASEIRNMGLGWAGAGYTVFIPDYIGYGLTSGKEHPYVYYPEMFISNIDGLLAVKQWLKQKGLSYNNRLFLTGWSQGGGASLSTHRYIQEKYPDEFTVVASSNLSGPYNFLRFAESFLTHRSENNEALLVFSWGLYAVNKFSGLRRPTDQIYSYPVYDQLSALVIPSNKPNDIFNQFFLDRFLDSSDVALKAELQKNSFYQGWRPVGKVFLHHGDADQVVAYFNALDARKGLRDAGGDVKLYTYPGGRHETELGKFTVNTLTDFDQLP